MCNKQSKICVVFRSKVNLQKLRGLRLAGTAVFFRAFPFKELIEIEIAEIARKYFRVLPCKLRDGTDRFRAFTKTSVLGVP